jgi:hypothetical protein
MDRTDPRSISWFASRGGRRYTLELAVVVIAKLVALTILYFAFIAPQPRTDLSPDALQRHLLDAQSAANPGKSP